MGVAQQHVRGVAAGYGVWQRWPWRPAVETTESRLGVWHGTDDPLKGSVPLLARRFDTPKPG